MKTIISALILSISASAALANSTREVWLDDCARCHGDSGNANTPLGRSLKIRDYTQSLSLDNITDEQIMELIKSGKNLNGKQIMPAYGTMLSKAEISNLVPFVRKLARNEIIARR